MICRFGSRLWPYIESVSETAAPGEPGQPRTWDIVATTVELILLALAGMVSSFAGLMLVMASDSCGTGTTECSTGIILLGVGLAVVAPWVALLAMGTWAVVRLVRRKLAWWVPLLAVPLWALVFALGVAVTFAGVS